MLYLTTLLKHWLRVTNDIKIVVSSMIQEHFLIGLTEFSERCDHPAIAPIMWHC